MSLLKKPVFIVLFCILNYPVFASIDTAGREKMIKLALESAQDKAAAQKSIAGEKKISGQKYSQQESVSQDLLVEDTVERKWEFGTEVSSITYKEPGVMKEKGVMSGINASYTYRGWLPPAPNDGKRTMLRLEGRFTRGEVDYKNSGTIDNIRDYMVELRGLLGPDYYYTRNNGIFSPYAGLGYRYLNDDTSGLISSTGKYGYERESNYYYIPIGADLTMAIKNNWTIGANLEYDFFVGGHQISHLSDVDPGLNDPDNKQNNGYGLRGSVKLIRQLDKIDLVLEPFFRYWNIEKSDDANLTNQNVIVGYGYEPKNNSTECGLKLAAKF